MIFRVCFDISYILGPDYPESGLGRQPSRARRLELFLFSFLSFYNYRTNQNGKIFQSFQNYLIVFFTRALLTISSFILNKERL